jgi:hypothetical protein
VLQRYWWVMSAGTPLVSERERRRALDASAAAGGLAARGEAVRGGARDGDAGQARGFALDSEGRRRFHGAFTGGFSAGYFNSVGSAEGWAPRQTFTSGAAPREQRPEDFMDEEDAMTLGDGLRSSAAYGAGPRLASAHTDPLAALVLAPESVSAGQRILHALGWRPGQGLGPRQQVGASGRRELADGTLVVDIYSAGRSFAPPDISPFRAADNHAWTGLGYAGSAACAVDQAPASRSAARGRGGIGMGVVDDDDDVMPLGASVVLPYGHDEEDAHMEEDVLGGGRAGTSRLHEMNRRLSQALQEQSSAQDPLAGYVAPSKPDPLPKRYPALPPLMKEPVKAQQLPPPQQEQQQHPPAAPLAQRFGPPAESPAASAAPGGIALGGGSGKSVFSLLTPEARARIFHATGRSTEQAAVAATGAEEASERSPIAAPPPAAPLAQPPPTPAVEELRATRTVYAWEPQRLLCERLGVPVPSAAASAGLPPLSAAVVAPAQRKTAIEWNKQLTFVQPVDAGDKLLRAASDCGLRPAIDASAQHNHNGGGDDDNGHLASWQDRPDAAVFKEIFDAGDAAAAMAAEEAAQQDGGNVRGGSSSSSTGSSSSSSSSGAGDGPTTTEPSGRVMFKPRTNRGLSIAALVSSTLRSSSSSSINSCSLRAGLGLAATDDKSRREVSQEKATAAAAEGDDEEELPNWAVAALANNNKSSKKAKQARH